MPLIHIDTTKQTNDNLDLAARINGLKDLAPNYAILRINGGYLFAFSCNNFEEVCGYLINTRLNYELEWSEDY